MSANAGPRRAPAAGDEYHNLTALRESAASPCRCGYRSASTPHTTCICRANTPVLNPYPTPPPTGRHAGAPSSGFSPPSEKLSINYLLQGGKPPTPDSPSSRRGQASRGSELPASLLAQLPTGRNRHRCYHLEVIQHPLAAAEYGSSALSRLPISPPLVVQLIVKDGAGATVQDESEIPFLVCHLSLASASGPSGASSAHRLLYGTLVSSPHRLRNVDGKPGVFFVFPDVSIRQRGRYRLGVTLINVMSGLGPAPPGGSANGSKGGGNVLASAWSASFNVVPLNEYVAPAQTALTQAFVRQGVQMLAFAVPTSLSRGSG